MDFSSNSLMGDITKMAGGVLNTADAMRHEMTQHFKAKVEAFCREQNLVSREELEVLHASHRQLYQEVEALKREVAALKEEQDQPSVTVTE